jgi:dipeptidyl aminopeptidase/acylaminoacyl peptidase
MVTTANGKFKCAADASTCEKDESLPPPATEVLSPDGTAVAFIRDYNLWVRETGAGHERQLTADGAEGFPYGHLLLFDTGRVERRRTNTPEPVTAVEWSPDGRYIATLREDTRALRKRSYIKEHLPPDNTFTVIHEDYIVTVADRSKPDNEFAVIDVSDGNKTIAELDAGQLRDFAPFHFATGNIWWNTEGGEVFIVTADYGGQTYGITGIDMETGKTRTVVEETEEHYYAFSALDYAPPSFYVTSNGGEAIFYSQRSGAGHLYLYNAMTGELKNPITDGKGVVFEIIRIDEEGREVYFTAGGRMPGRNPYHTQLYRVGFDGGEVVLLTPEDAVHAFSGTSLGAGGGQSQFSPSGNYFVDVFSTTSQPPEMVIRTRAGELIAPVLSADISALKETGWRPPEQFIVKAADGKTDLYGAMFKPTDFDPGRKYAVVDQTYPGPQIDSAPHSFLDNFAAITTRNAQATAEAGFIVVALDGRGTTRRDRAFRYAFSGTEDAFGSADHKAAIENLARAHPWLDATRVGITGASFGGYGSLRAALLHPDFFDVVVSHVGPHEYMHSVISGDFTNERFFGPPGSERDIHEKASNIAIIDRLEADLMLVYGEIDENVPFRAAMTIFNALIEADKDYTSYVVPNATHGGAASHPYIVKRQRQFFIDHLGGPVDR